MKNILFYVLFAGSLCGSACAYSMEEKAETKYWREALAQSMSPRKGQEILADMLETFDRESRYEGDRRTFPQWAIDAGLWFDEIVEKDLKEQKFYQRFLPLIVTAALAGLVLAVVPVDPSIRLFGIALLLSPVFLKPTGRDLGFNPDGREIRYDIIRNVFRIIRERGLLVDQRTQDLIRELCKKNPTPPVLRALAHLCPENAPVAHFERLS